MPAELGRVSPLEASVRYLEHLRAAWDQAHPEAPFAGQDVTVTIPASFDPAARELTLEAAKARAIRADPARRAAGGALQLDPDGTGRLAQQARPGDVILVVDVGGGTSDFSLIAVLEREGSLELHRVAVGEHILLGGDNMDLALAHVVARKLSPPARRSMRGSCVPCPCLSRRQGKAAGRSEAPACLSSCPAAAAS
jgi:molecular chaperone DnaK (HSP70)